MRGTSRDREGSKALWSALSASVFALATGLALWGFTVDDALITCRYAHHVATGRGYVFNPGGPVTDGVTPLGLPYLLAPFASGGTLQALAAAKALGIAAHALAAGLVAWAVSTLGGPKLRWLGVALWLVAAPAAAWSASGLETPLAELLVAAGAALRVTGRREPLGVALLGAAAAVRPELLPLAVTLGAPRGEGSSEAVGARTFGRIALACAPFTAVALARVALFGRPGPLSALAKPADVTAGLQYAFVCVLVVGAVGLVAPLALGRADRMTRWLSAGFWVHAAAVAFAGGDWMPVSRLFVPALPVLALAVAGIARASSPRAVALRAALALAGELWVWGVVGYKLVRVQADRDALIAEARPLLASSRVIASLDVGWLGAAAPSATIVDLAGVTDPEIAALPGGHLRKKIPDGLLEDRQVDTLVMQLYKDHPVAEPWSATVFARGLEIYVATEPGLEDRFAPSGVLEGRARYVILQRR